MVMGNMAAGHLYSRLIPLVLLLVDGDSSMLLGLLGYFILYFFCGLLNV